MLGRRQSTGAAWTSVLGWSRAMSEPINGASSRRRNPARPVDMQYEPDGDSEMGAEGSGQAYRRPSRRQRQVPSGAPARKRKEEDRHGRQSSEHGFKCGHCKRFIGLLPSGGHYRNHCPICLYSRHVDGETSGDRSSSCRALMAPIGVFARRNGEHVLVHRCLGCGFERFNRIAADDDFDLVLSLPELPPRSASR